MSKLEETLADHIRFTGLPEPMREFRFACECVGGGPGVRQRLRDAGLQDWRFDFAWPYLKIAVEVQGGTYSQGAHVRGAGYENDCRKGNAARLLGWTVYAFTGRMVTSGEAITVLEKALVR